MTTEKTATTQQAKPNLTDNYRPLGLKAVLAAALMVKRKPTKKVA